MVCAGIICIAIAYVVAHREYRRIKNDIEKYGKITFLVLALELVTFSPFAISVLLALLGVLFLFIGSGKGSLSG